MGRDVVMSEKFLYLAAETLHRAKWPERVTACGPAGLTRNGLHHRNRSPDHRGATAVHVVESPAERRGHAGSRGAQWRRDAV